jgi:hypothetical protein
MDTRQQTGRHPRRFRPGRGVGAIPRGVDRSINSSGRPGPRASDPVRWAHGLTCPDCYRIDRGETGDLSSSRWTWTALSRRKAIPTDEVAHRRLDVLHERCSPGCLPGSQDRDGDRRFSTLARPVRSRTARGPASRGGGAAAARRGLTERHGFRYSQETVVGLWGAGV